MKTAFLLLMLGMSAWGQGVADVRVKAADAVAKNCPHGKHWERGNYISEALQHCLGSNCSVGGSGSYEDSDYYHCVVDDPPEGNAAIDVPAVKEMQLPVFVAPPKLCNVGDFIEGYSREYGCTSDNFWRELPTGFEPNKSQSGEWCHSDRSIAWQFKDDRGHCHSFANETGRLLGCASCPKDSKDCDKYLDACRVPGRKEAADTEKWFAPIYSCADKRRVKLQSEDGKWHCFLIPKERP